MRETMEAQLATQAFLCAKLFDKRRLVIQKERLRSTCYKSSDVSFVSMLNTIAQSYEEY
jgi:hypothetical protein